MWYLKSEHDGSLFYLLAGKTYTIGRKQGDLVLASDQSISRNHSAILISNEGEVFLWDEGSKYGTFVYEGGSEVKLEPQKRTKIKIGDKLRFGLQWNVYVLGKMSYVVCSSSITLEEKRLMKSLLPKIGASFSNDWNDHCSHLVMNQVSLTHKVVLALAAGKPITTVQYWEKMLDAIPNQLVLPKIEEYLPPVGEKELQRQTSQDTLLPRENRKSLFEGKVFVFSSVNTMNKIKALVDCGGGVCQSVQTLKLPPKVCCEPGYIVVKESEVCKQLMPDIFAALKRKGLRSVPVSEIGLAIYNNSLTRYCNPSWRKPVLLGGPPSQSQGVCLVENTEDIPVNTQDMKVEQQEIIVIPPSLGSGVNDTSIDSSRSVKRPLSTSPADNPPPKRQAQQKDTATNSGTLYQGLRSSSASTKESEATCSFDVSRDDLFETKSQRRQRDETEISKSSKNETYLFKKPSPKKNTGVKRGRIDDDMFEVPSPKKAPTAGKATKKLPSPIKVVNIEDDKLDETIEDDSDDEFRIPSRKKSPPPRIEDDEFELQKSFSKDRNRNKRMNKPREEEQSDKSRRTISLPPTKAVSRIETRVTESRVEAQTTGCRALDPRPVTRIEASTATITDSTRSNGRGNTSHAPSLSEFLDKSAGVPIKKDEEKDEIDKEILNINYEIGEMSLRTRPPLRDISTNSVIDGRPNFKKFRKPRLQTDRTRIDLILNDDVSMFEEVPGPEETIPNCSPGHRDEVSASQDVLAVFPFTNERNGSARQNRLRLVPDSDIVDDWTVP